MHEKTEAFMTKALYLIRKGRKMDRPADLSRCAKCRGEFTQCNLYFAPDDYLEVVFWDRVKQAKELGVNGDNASDRLDAFIDRTGFMCADCMQDVARSLNEMPEPEGDEPCIREALE